MKTLICAAMLAGALVAGVASAQSGPPVPVPVAPPALLAPDAPREAIAAWLAQWLDRLPGH